MRTTCVISMSRSMDPVEVLSRVCQLSRLLPVIDPGSVLNSIPYRLSLVTIFLKTGLNGGLDPMITLARPGLQAESSS